MKKEIMSNQRSQKKRREDIEDKQRLKGNKNQEQEYEKGKTNSKEGGKEENQLRKERNIIFHNTRTCNLQKIVTWQKLTKAC